MNEEKTTKLKLISDIIEARVSSDKDEVWYGEQFDRLYDEDVDTLKLILNLATKKKSKNE